MGKKEKTKKTKRDSKHYGADYGEVKFIDVVRLVLSWMSEWFGLFEKRGYSIKDGTEIQ